MNRLDTSQPWEQTTTQQQRLQRDITSTYQGQIERGAKAVSIQRTAENIVGAILRYNQSTEGIQRAQQEQRNKQRLSAWPQYTEPRYTPRAYVPGKSGEQMIYRNAPHLRTTEERLRCGCSECRSLLGEYGQGYKRFR